MIPDEHPMSVLALLFLAIVVVSCLLFPPLIIVWLLFFGAWTRWDEWRERERSRKLK